MGGDFPGNQSLCRQGQHDLIDARQPALALADDLWIERAIGVPRYLDLDRADLGEYRLGPGAVTRPTGGWVGSSPRLLGSTTVRTTGPERFIPRESLSIGFRPRANGTKFGRPRKVDDSEHIATAKRMKADGHTGKDIAKYLGVSRATLYRYLAEDHAA